VLCTLQTTPFVDVFTSIDSALFVPVSLTELEANVTKRAQFEATFKGDIAAAVSAAGVSADNVTINNITEADAATATPRRSTLRVTVARVLLLQGGGGAVVDYSVDFPPVRVLQTEAGAVETPTAATVFADALAANPSTLLKTLSDTYGALEVTVPPVTRSKTVVLFPPPAPPSPAPPGEEVQR
jgi:hypothetical protein